jgi:hypothetical protein
MVWYAAYEVGVIKQFAVEFQRSRAAVGTYSSAATRTIPLLSLLAHRREAGNPYPATNASLVWLYLLLLANIPKAIVCFLMSRVAYV